MAKSPVAVSWCSQQSQIADTIRLFLANTPPSYISHGELQCGRAATPTEWNRDLKTRLHRELTACVKDCKTSRRSRWLAIATRDHRVCGLAIVSYSRGVTPQFATLEDLVVAQTERRNGIGSAILSWVEHAVNKHGVGMLFIESGIRNRAAHRFFKNRGFRPVSQVMLKIPGQH